MRFVLLIATVMLSVTGPAVGAKTVVVANTLEAALGHPKVQVQLRNGAHVLSGPAPSSLLRRGAHPAQPSRSFPAYLDTGASASVLTEQTLIGFGGEVDRHGVYHEFGLHGEIEMGVSLPYGVALAAPGTSAEEFRVLSDASLFEVNRAAADPMQELVMGPLNVIGMPFISQLVVEITPTSHGYNSKALLQQVANALSGGSGALGGLGTDPRVALHPGSFRPKRFDVEVPLVYRDFSRHENPEDVAPKPDLAKNPVLERVLLRHRGRKSVGDWLLDTGAATSFISTAQARRLGLLKAPATFILPVSGISGQPESAPGHRIRTIEIRGVRKTLLFKDAHVMVKDIAAKLDDGRVVILDGLLGNNLLLSSVGGLTGGLPTRSSPSPFEKITLDGPRGRLFLKMR
ncbi:MAG: retropepsin-like aspartic protease [Myxococcota bacterium]